MVGRQNPVRRERARVSYIPGQIAIKVYFDELMRVVLPLTEWWHSTYNALRRLQHQGVGEPADWKDFPMPDPLAKRERDLLEALMLMRREIDHSLTHDVEPQDASGVSRQRYIRQIPADLSWLVRIAGVIGDCFMEDQSLLDEGSASERLRHDVPDRDQERIETRRESEDRRNRRRIDNEFATETQRRIVTGFTGLFDQWVSNNDYPNEYFIWSVTKNRPVFLAVADSALTVKADAARSLFGVSCRDITWAILDSGIDQNHPAFKLTTAEHDLDLRRNKAQQSNQVLDYLGGEDLPELAVDELQSRVVKTLDFTRLRSLLDYDVEYPQEADPSNDERRRLQHRIACQKWKDHRHVEGRDCNPPTEYLNEAGEVLDRLRTRIEEGHEISWEDLEGAVVVENPEVPVNDHGTHVAGILAADWIEDLKNERKLPLSARTRRMRGICPDINLIDVRIFREDGLTDEFELLAAIQFLRWLNSRAGSMEVHGVNVSLQLLHEVRRFACGQTPICRECDEAVSTGVVVVAAAGNRGFDQSDISYLTSSDAYRSVSITDPGNAEGVITVGATHRKRPHEYGVSYFSSRGPTGDGRLKPDLVAPGEKILGPTPGRRAEYKDGTSMAAPHVSGAAAMLMARHKELIGRPHRIKAILCDTATDLGRERYFQGSGLLDILRALQSV
jgi:subtilisin family serine protease